MSKFNYVKWVTDNKHGLLTEQIGTSSVGGGCNPFTVGGASSTNPCCYYCDSGSYNNPINPPQGGSGPADPGSITSWGGCATTNNQNFGSIDPSDPSLSACFITSLAGCDSLAWSNYSNWQSTWTNNNAFNSNNPNQPCNHICQKIQQWTNMGSGTIPLPPVQDNIVQCKLAVGQNQSQIHGCNC